MTTKLDINVRKIIAEHGGTVVKRGVTGGNWRNGYGIDEGWLTCARCERNNLSAWIKDQPDADLIEGKFGAFYRLRGYCVATGAGYGGSKHHRAKQIHYAVIKIDEGSK